MNWLRTILDGIIVCIAFNGVAAFVWLLEPKGFSVMLPKGINTPLKELSKKEIKPIRLMEFILYPILCLVHGMQEYMGFGTYSGMHIL